MASNWGTWGLGAASRFLREATAEGRFGEGSEGSKVVLAAEKVAARVLSVHCGGGESNKTYMKSVPVKF